YTINESLFFNMDKLEKQLNEEEFNEEIAMVVFKTQEKMINMVKDKCDDGLVIKARIGTESEMQNESGRSRNDTRVEGENTTSPMKRENA
ncbi:hypothetical protein Tco_0275046, partial [Tanacetum coccineum]